MMCRRFGVHLAIALAHSLVVLLTSLVLLPQHRYHVPKMDGLIYLRLAEKYAAGNFTSEVLTGVWSPGLSWAIAPLLSLGIEPLLAHKLVQVLAGMVGAGLVYWLALQFKMKTGVRLAITFTLCLLPITFIMNVNTPDLLATNWLLGYLILFFHPNFGARWWHGLICGTLIAGAYFTKAYLLYFCLTHLLLMTGLHLAQARLKRDRRQCIVQSLVAVGVCAVIVAPWVTALSLHYDQFTISTAGAYNLGLVGPSTNPDLIQEDHLDHPLAETGLHQPTNPSALSAWEDPSQFTGESWQPLASPKHTARLIWRNLGQAIGLQIKHNPFAIVILLAAPLLARRRGHWTRERAILLWATATVLLFIAGYTPLMIKFRLLIPVIILTALLGGAVLDEAFRAWHARLTAITAATIVYAYALAAPFVPQIPQTILEHTWFEQTHNVAKHMASYGIHGRLASNGYYYRSQMLAFYLDSQYYGSTHPVRPEAIPISLQTHQIDYYISWDDHEPNPYLARAGWQPLPGAHLPDSTVYYRPTP